MFFSMFIRFILPISFICYNFGKKFNMFSYFQKIKVSDQELLSSIYDYEVKDLSGSNVSMSKFKNKVLIIFNSASKCGLTKNHVEQFNKLHERYNSRGLEILAFPTSQFLNQEFDSTKDICTFNEKNKIKYNMFAPIEVNGDNTHPLFKYLKKNCDSMHDENGTLKSIGWNFGKFLVDRNGDVVNYFSPKTNPLDLEKIIIQLLQK
ncbi:glutathione peroxidase-like thioredoxin peroxidase [Plasmodium sp. gorilla clade G2]|uniref:glutathione peroxidase-like thioredoxin peroxidase n=1 Tax=Plasmodium sp. gorilla clade G2 TaxID=880535 RepID=UPI000D21D3B2|nr:glutathione peroxidase-like thioredoxin peroxidase [Plasmodium sp. gorilla clade G2]SOV16671.1 glutathione peroxidase-like thioredoxin peroxidase [Plasmodium sp. gorilla clade G2]